MVLSIGSCIFDLSESPRIFRMRRVPIHQSSAAKTTRSSIPQSISPVPGFQSTLCQNHCTKVTCSVTFSVTASETAFETCPT